MDFESLVEYGEQKHKGFFKLEIDHFARDGLCFSISIKRNTGQLYYRIAWASTLQEAIDQAKNYYDQID